MIKPFFKPALYLSARISPDAHAYNDKVASLLEGYFDVFKPHAFQASESDHTQIGISVYNQDIGAMEMSDLAVILPPYGRDCSWEIGWYKGRNIPAFMYVETDDSFLRDMMLKGGLNGVFTPNEAMYKRLMKDPILRNKVRFLESPEELGKRLILAFNQLRAGQVLMEPAT